MRWFCVASSERWLPNRREFMQAGTFLFSTVAASPMKSLVARERWLGAERVAPLPIGRGQSVQAGNFFPELP